ncbi:hypothetical protein F3Y22_tig00117005pilonHSYRG00022 [Hibiscus syriacus]|uniref:Uncharacterized protein n=1 Tax=Hibiscus syriacus TaxID=106335 RepID=A0A6A2XQL5_HIBSY|nr:hypothetical protein F3Y22_tig00117005pilonHSYRG00022 [Hibiscus syriacus]
MPNNQPIPIFAKLSASPLHALGIHLTECTLSEMSDEISLTRGADWPKYFCVGQFVDLCGTIDDIRKAWNRHIKCFPDSARKSTYKFSVVNGIKSISLMMAAARRQESPGFSPSHPSGDGSSDISVRSLSQDNILEPPNVDDSQPYHDALDCVSDKKSSLLEDHEIPLSQATVNNLQSGEFDERLQGEMQQSSQDDSKHAREEDIKANANISSCNLICDSGKGS